MKRSVSSILVLAGFALAGCDSTSDTSSRDILAEDSTLNLAVMSASGDSVPTVSDTSIEPAASAALPGETGPAIAGAAPEPAPIVTPAPRATRKSRTVSAVKRTTASRVNRSRIEPKVTTRRTTSRPVQRRVAAGSRPAALESRVARTEASLVRSTTMRSTTRVPAGWELTFATAKPVCANATAIGDKFNVHLVDDVVGPIGVVIPKGAVATGVVSSVRKNGNRSDIDVDIESLEYDGRTYPVASDVTYTTTKKVRTRRANTGKVAAGAGTGAVAGAVIGKSTKATIIGAAAGALGGAVLANQARTYDECVPEGGRITTRLTEPLLLTSAE